MLHPRNRSGDDPAFFSQSNQRCGVIVQGDQALRPQAAQGFADVGQSPARQRPQQIGFSGPCAPIPRRLDGAQGRDRPQDVNAAACMRGKRRRGRRRRDDARVFQG